MATLKVCLVQFLNGFKDSLYGFIKFIQRQKKLTSTLTSQEPNKKSNKLILNKDNILKRNDKLYKRLLQSCILNGIFLFSCICAFNYVLIPVLNAIAFKVISVSNHDLIHNYLNPTIQIIFSSVWILPVFLLSKIFNVLCHQEIADISYEQKYGKPKILKTFSQVIADTFFSCTMELIFLIQSSCMGLIPATWLNTLLCHVHTSFLYSLYAFEYKLCNKNWDIRERINHIESRWPYYLGFGMSMSLILSFAGSYIYSATLFGFIFPAFILSAIESDSEKLQPVMYLKRDLNSPYEFKPQQLTIPLFNLSLYITDSLFKFFTSKPNKKLSEVNKPVQQTFTIRKTN